MNGNPSKAQKVWHEFLRDYACIICCDYNPAIHHIKGSKMKLKGCVKPGESYVIPLCYKHHQGPEGVHANKRNYDEKRLWQLSVMAYQEEHGEKPMSEYEYQIILERG